jgi:16S rRNA (adenine1518-N6/adenine1519-N6)-dimethyltransferase
MALADLVAAPPAIVVANLPYHITTPVIFFLLERRAYFPRAVLMVQREVGERLAASPGGKEWGITSVLVQSLAEVRIAFRVSRRCFLPVPNVDSVVIDLAWTVAPRVDIGEPDVHRAVVRSAFGQRRKMLRNALLPLAAGRLGGEVVRAACAAAGIDPRARAETLDLEAFGRLARAFAALRSHARAS